MDGTDKDARYDEVVALLRHTLPRTSDRTARMATVAAVLHKRLPHFFWTGFYLLRDGDLVVGPYQGAPACIVLPPHRGVCWAALERGEPILVPNVHRFPDHVACEGPANSELVVPMRGPDGRPIGVLDVDSADFDAFDETDVRRLEEVLALLDT
jgi:GAF domain-containing protein